MHAEPRHWLDAPPALAARGIALEYLAAADDARRRLRDHADDEALHDFRVALRRLRSTIRLYRPWLGEQLLPRKLRRRLKRLARMTNAARDAEVGLAWIRRQRRFLPRHSHGGVQWFADELEARRQAAYEEIHAEAMTQFDALYPRLRAVLRQRHRAAAATTPLLRDAIDELVSTQIAALNTGLGHIQSAQDAEAIHAARIDAKRLRYLLEPLIAGRAEGKRCIKLLKEFQDRLGQFCDRTVLTHELLETAERVGAERAARGIEAALRGQRRKTTLDRLPALMALSAHVQAQRERCFRDIRRRYLGARTDALLAPFRSLAQALAKAPRRTRARTTLPKPSPVTK